MSASPMSEPADLEIPDEAIVCYCTNLTARELRETCAAGRWPPPGKEHSGRLCTGCMGDLLHCLRRLGLREDQ